MGNLVWVGRILDGRKKGGKWDSGVPWVGLSDIAFCSSGPRLHSASRSLPWEAAQRRQCE